jgi:hypothetical protein
VTKRHAGLETRPTQRRDAPSRFQSAGERRGEPQTKFLQSGSLTMVLKAYDRTVPS